MMDAFGGCCVYDEGCAPSLRSLRRAGLAASPATTPWPWPITATTISSLWPSIPCRRPLAHGRDLVLEGRVHRWAGTINALPGGNPVRETRDRHVPDPHRYPGLYVVGDYLFDSTLNGVLDSADFVTDLILTELRKQKYAVPAVNGHAVSADRRARFRLARRGLPRPVQRHEQLRGVFRGLLLRAVHDRPDPHGLGLVSSLHAARLRLGQRPDPGGVSPGSASRPGVSRTASTSIPGRRENGGNAISTATSASCHSRTTRLTSFTTRACVTCRRKTWTRPSPSSFASAAWGSTTAESPPT